MDKKNTMLLTVIAVATLLVAVVGATFAYFTVSSTNSTATTSVTTKAEAVGTVALTNGTQAFYLNVTTAQMAEDLKGTKTYYAQTTDVASTTEAPSPIAVANFSAIAVDDAEVTYSCTFDYTIEPAAGTAANALTVLKNDGVYQLTAGNGVTLDETTYNLGESQSGSGSLTLTDGNSTSISAVASLKNSTDEQNAIAGLSIKTTITFSNFICETK